MKKKMGSCVLAAMLIAAIGTSNITPVYADENKETTNLKMAMFSTGEMTDASLVNDAVNEYLSDYGLSVDITYINYGSWTEQTNLLLTGGTGSIDVLPLFITPLSTYVNNGQVLVLDDYYEEYKDQLNGIFSDEIMNSARVDGKMYGIPTQRDLASYIGWNCRTDILEEAGYTASDRITLDEIHDILTVAHENHPELYPLVPQGSGSMVYDWGWDNLGDSKNLGVIADPLNDTTVESLFETKPFIDFCTTMREWYKEGLIMADAISTTESAESMLKAGRACSYFANMKPGFEEQSEQAIGMDMTSIQVLDSSVRASDPVGLLWGIASCSSDPEAAMKLLVMMYTDPTLSNLLINGVEGVDYVYTDDNKDMITYPEGVDGTSTGYVSLGWGWPNQFITPVWDSYALDYFEQLDEFNKNAPTSLVLGCVPDLTSLANEVTACNNVMTRYYMALMTGSVDVEETIETANREFEDAGLNKIIEFKQNAVDEFLKSKEK